VFKRKQNGPVHLKILRATLDDVFGDKVRVHHTIRPFARSGEVVVVQHGRLKVRLVASGASEKDTIQLDQRSRQRLGLTGRPSPKSAEFTFMKGNWIDEYRWAWRASDAMPRIAARVGIVSLAMGAVGMLLGTLSLF